MISQREIKRKYTKLMHDVKTKEFYDIDLTNRVNCYVCDCGHVTKTKDIDAGLTPFFFDCEKCGSHKAKSTFFNDIKPDCEPTIEWFRPSLEQVLKFRRKNELLVEHILKGGLHHRRI